MKLEDAISGRKVVYTPFKNCDIKLVEEGIITSKNDKFVFVRYAADVYSKSTRPEDIEYIVQYENMESYVGHDSFTETRSAD